MPTPLTRGPGLFIALLSQVALLSFSTLTSFVSYGLCPLVCVCAAACSSPPPQQDPPICTSHTPSIHSTSFPARCPRKIKSHNPCCVVCLSVHPREHQRLEPSPECAPFIILQRQLFIITPLIPHTQRLMVRHSTTGLTIEKL